MVEKSNEDRQADSRISDSCARSTSKPGKETARKTTMQISEKLCEVETATEATANGVKQTVPVTRASSTRELKPMMCGIPSK